MIRHPAARFLSGPAGERTNPPDPPIHYNGRNYSIPEGNRMPIRLNILPASRTTRREFLAGAGAGIAATYLAQKAEAAPPDARGEWRNRQTGMAYRQLGKTGFMISEMVMGGNHISPENYEHVLMALDTGLNYLDTAAAYGNGRSEQGYARVIASRKRDSFFLNSKVSLWDINRGKLYQEIFDSLPESGQKRIKSQVREEIEKRRVFEPDYILDYFPSQRGEVESAVLANVMSRQYGHKVDRQKNYKQLILDSVDQSLTRLGTDHLDLLMCPHGASTPFELLEHHETFEAFETLKKAGKVRHLGVSAHSDPAGILDAAVDAKVYSAAMVAYSIVNHPFVAKSLERAHKNGLGVIAMKVARPVHHGRDHNQPNDPRRLAMIHKEVKGDLKAPQKAYLFALRNPSLTAVISELINADLVQDNMPLAAPKKPV
jgi:aryl-alcohol dehydrogenase-like predicted oxidoreductase